MIASFILGLLVGVNIGLFLGLRKWRQEPRR